MTRDVRFPATGRHLAGTLFTADRRGPEPAPGLLFIHGFRSDRSGYRERAEAASAASGAACLTFDLSGHGHSAGDLSRLTRRDHLADTVAAYDELVSRGGADAGRIGVCGASYGAYLACLLTAERPVKRILLRAPALYDDRDLDVPLGQTVRSDAGVHTALLAASLGRFPGDTLILESGADEVIPHAVIDAYRQIAPHARHCVIDGATHALTEAKWRETFRATIVDWFGAL